MKNLSRPSASEETVYGRRDGAITALAITYRDKTNVFRQSKGFKQGVVSGVKMCPRSAMYKPDRVPLMQVSG